MVEEDLWLGQQSLELYAVTSSAPQCWKDFEKVNFKFSISLRVLREGQSMQAFFMICCTFGVFKDQNGYSTAVRMLTKSKWCRRRHKTLVGWTRVVREVQPFFKSSAVSALRLLI